MGDMDGIDFVLKFKGTTYGLGTTFAGGVGNWFGLLDLNYTRTKLNIIDGNIKAFTLAPRVGYRFVLPAIDTIKLPQSKFSLWVGTMYQNVDQNFHGKLSKLSFSPKLQSLIAQLTKGRAHSTLSKRWSLRGTCWPVSAGKLLRALIFLLKQVLLSATVSLPLLSIVSKIKRVN